MRARVTLCLSLILSLVTFTGCVNMSPTSDPVRVGPFFTPKNFAGERVMPVDVRRVVVLPIYGGRLAETESLESLDTALLTALQKQARFEIVVLSRQECLRRFGATELLSTAVLPTDFMDTIARAYAADAVLFTDLTVYDAYRPLAIGLRAKLATLKDPRMIWNFDEIFSTNDPAVANSARQFYLGSQGGMNPTDTTSAALQSPSKFAGYVMSAMFTTLPPR